MSSFRRPPTKYTLEILGLGLQTVKIDHTDAWCIYQMIHSYLYGDLHIRWFQWSELSGESWVRPLYRVAFHRHWEWHWRRCQWPWKDLLLPSPTASQCQRRGEENFDLYKSQNALTSLLTVLPFKYLSHLNGWFWIPAHCLRHKLMSVVLKPLEDMST